MTCEYSIKIHCDAIQCCECIDVSVDPLLSEAAKKGWTNIEDHDYCPVHSKTKAITYCPYCKKDSVVISGVNTGSCYTLCTCCGMRGPRKGSTIEAITAWNNFCKRSK
jgi:hypothetical protein